MFPFMAPAIIKSAVAILKPQDVFATSLRTADGTAQNVINGIDLAGRGGLVWDKSRTNAVNHVLTDTVRGVNKALFTNTTGAEVDGAGVSAFLSNGYTYTTSNGDSRVGWSFARAPKFFDIVTWTGDGTSNRQIPHGLGVVPGMIIARNRNLTSNWHTTHRSLSNPLTGRLQIDTTNAEAAPAAGVFTSGTTATVISVGAGGLNVQDVLYVALLFAHDPSADGIVQCGSATADQFGDAFIGLPWTPQWVMFKSTTSALDWIIADTTRGATYTSPNAKLIRPNTSGAETLETNKVNMGAAGVNVSNYVPANGSLIWVAIRAPY